MRRITWPIGLGGLLTPLLAAGADASVRDSVDAYDLDEIVVTASRRAEETLRAPYSVNVQDMRELSEVRQVRTIPDAMRELPGVMVQKTGHGQGSPYIRGFTGLRTLFLIDGIRLNNSTFREGPNQYWNTVDSLTVQRLELVKGPSSVLYGSDAVGGTVSVKTRSYSDLAAEDSRGRLVARAALAEGSILARPEVGLAGDKVSLFAAASFKNFGDLEAGGDTGTQEKTGYDEQDFDFKLSYILAEGRELTAAVQRVSLDDAWRTHKTIYGSNWKGTTHGSELQRSLDQRRTLSYLQFAADEPWGLTDGRLMFSLSYHEQEERRLRIRSDARSDRQGTDVATLGFWGQIDIPTAGGAWIAGVDIYRDHVDSFRRDFNADGTLRAIRIQGPVADDASYETSDIFLQRQAAIGRRGNLQAGVRYTRIRANARVVENPLTGEQMSIRDEWDRFVGSIRYSHALSNDARVFAGASQGFRAPNLSDLTRYDSARSNEIETPVAGLDPERFITYELGVKIDTGSWSGQASIFHTLIEDQIIRTPTGLIIDGDNEVTKRNAGQGAVNGIELQGRIALGESWSVFANLTWIDGEVDTFPDSSTEFVREPLDRLAPARAFLGSRWRPPSAPYWVEGLLSVAGRQDKLSTRDRSDTDRIPANGTPGYSVMTLRGGWRFSDRLSFSVAAENVFDKDYRIHGSGVNEPGRNLIVSIFRSFE